jgi:hypothetical protein
MITAQYMGTSMLTNALQVRIDEPGVLSPVVLRPVDLALRPAPFLLWDCPLSCLAPSIIADALLPGWSILIRHE